MRTQHITPLESPSFPTYFVPDAAAAEEEEEEEADAAAAAADAADCFCAKLAGSNFHAERSIFFSLRTSCWNSIKSGVMSVMVVKALRNWINSFQSSEN